MKHLCRKHNTASDPDEERRLREQRGNSHPLNNRGKHVSWNVAAYASVTIIVVIVSAGVLLFHFLPDLIVNRFVKGRVLEEFAGAFPAYALQIGRMDYHVWENRIACDSVVLTTVDSTFSCTLASFSVSRIGWMHLLWGGNLSPHDFANSVVDAQDIGLSFRRERYELSCGRLQVSVPDSGMVIETLELHPSGDDEQFFAGSKFRKTRFRLVVPYARAIGLACLGLLQGKTYRARSVQVDDALLDVLLNKDKFYAKDTSSPPMPNEILSSIQGTLQVDSLSFTNGNLKYAERFAVGGKPALITLDSMRVLIAGIANHGSRGAAVAICAEGNFMKTGTMKLRISIPVASPELSFQYSGSLSRMDLRPINAFIETSEQMRVKTGVLQEATFEIKVDSGRASGSVRAVYKDLTLVVINKQTGSENGFFNTIASFIAKTTKIRGTNAPDTPASMKIGEVKYARKRDEFFLEFAWFALRSGVGDVVGF